MRTEEKKIKRLKKKMMPIKKLKKIKTGKIHIEKDCSIDY